MSAASARGGTTPAARTNPSGTQDTTQGQQRCQTLQRQQGGWHSRVSNEVCWAAAELPKATKTRLNRPCKPCERTRRGGRCSHGVRNTAAAASTPAASCQAQIKASELGQMTGSSTKRQSTRRGRGATPKADQTREVSAASVKKRPARAEFQTGGQATQECEARLEQQARGAGRPPQAPASDHRTAGTAPAAVIPTTNTKQRAKS